jgi:glycerophosphoryl diester phosphodiesterase
VAGGGGYSEGFDQEADLQRIPDEYHGVIWTNRIDRIGPVWKQANETH